MILTLLKSVNSNLEREDEESKLQPTTQIFAVKLIYMNPYVTGTIYVWISMCELKVLGIIEFPGLKRDLGCLVQVLCNKDGHS